MATTYKTIPVIDNKANTIIPSDVTVVSDVSDISEFDVLFIFISLIHPMGRMG